MNLCKYLRLGASLVQHQSLREYAFKSDLKIKWVRPEKIPCIDPRKSGDATKLKPVNPDELLMDFEKSKELKAAEPLVQSMFTLKNNPRFHTSSMHREILIKEVQRHPLDYGSTEAKIARMTATIRRYQEHMETFPRDRRTKVKLKELIDKRKKFLKFLRRWDYPRFEWLLEKLGLVYKPPPAEFHWITRKESLQKLTDKYCEDLKQKRLAEYEKKLEAQMIPFLEEKISTLQFIRKEQEECGIPITIKEEEIEETRRELEKLKASRAQCSAEEDKSNEN